MRKKYHNISHKGLLQWVSPFGCTPTPPPRPQAEVGECLKQCRAERLDREGTLLRLATTVEGVYVPQFYESPAG